MNFELRLFKYCKFVQPHFAVSPMAILAFKQGVVGDTGLKTGWVRGTLRTSRIVPALRYKRFPITSENLRVSVCAVFSQFFADIHRTRQAIIPKGVSQPFLLFPVLRGYSPTASDGSKPRMVALE